MPNHLLLIALGPVQDFIATARRTRDLWFGSYLLSEISKAAARELHNKSQLIFPNPQSPEADLAPGQPDQLNVSNIIFTQVPDNVDPRDLAEEAIRSARRRLEELRQGAFAKINTMAGLDEVTARQQVADMLETAFAFTPLPTPIETHYGAARDRVYAMLAARKSLRNFVQPQWASAGIPKSSFDGAREIITPDPETHGQGVRGSKTLPPKQLEQLGMRAGEALCGVSLMKRLGVRTLNQRAFHFTSTSEIATRSLLRPKDQHAFSMYFDEIKALHINPDYVRADGAVVFESRLEEFLGDEAKDDKGADSEKLKRAKLALKKLLSKISKGKVPNPYYALLLADGDNMGAAIDALGKPDDHRKISSAVAAFAKSVANTVNAYRGSLIYSGGDDVLALLPLHEALECIRKLNRDFTAAVGHYDAPDHRTGQIQHPSLSAGLVIVHHLEPLQDALELARKAEKTAKGIEGKNALSVIVSKRGGVDVVATGKLEPLITRLQTSTMAHANDAIPDGAVFKLRELLHELGTMPDAQHLEALRLLKRSKTNDHATNAAIDKLSAVLIENEQKRLTSSANKQQTMQINPVISFEEIVNELIVARTFADAYSLFHRSDDEKEATT
jgi:CRISPR-associated protein Cmr2